MGQPLRVLMVEDNPDDAELLRYTLRRCGYEIAHEVVDTSAAMRAALKRQDWDLITSDHTLPQFSGPAALALAKELRPNSPVIMVSGETDDDLVAALLKNGAQDYIRKQDLLRIVAATDWKFQASR